MSGGGRRRRKWSKGKQKEKVNNAMLFDQPTTYDKLLSEIEDGNSVLLDKNIAKQRARLLLAV